MRFLFEAKQIFNDLLQAKSYLESQDNIQYEDLDEKERVDFIYDVFDLMNNSKILKKNSEAVINAIQDSRFGVTNQDVITYLNELNNNKIDNSTVNVITQLILNNSLDYGRNKFWLNNAQIYDKPVTDANYIIKVLTLASNPNLQKDYFNPQLKIDDFINNGKLYEIPKIKEILDDHQTKDVELKSSGKDIISNELNKQDITIDDIRQYTKSIYGDKLKSSIVDIINSSAFEDLIDSENILDNSYSNTKDGKAVDKLNQVLKNIISNISNSDEYKAQKQELDTQQKKEQEDKEKGKHGYDLISDILKSKGEKVTKETVLNYVKNLFADNNKKTIIADAVDNGVVNTELNKVLNARYKDTLISDAKELLDYAIQEAILKVIDG